MDNFRWQIPEQLAGMERPFVASGADAADDLAELLERGVSAIVSLTEFPLPAETADRGFDVLHQPVPDGSPPQMSQIDTIVAFIESRIAEGKGVAVHCEAGQGRTGTVLACYLVKTGVSAPEAIKQVRARRPGAIETSGQEQLIRHYARRVGRQDESP